MISLSAKVNFPFVAFPRGGLLVLFFVAAAALATSLSSAAAEPLLASSTEGVGVDPLLHPEPTRRLLSAQLWTNPTVCKGNDLFAAAVEISGTACPSNAASCVVVACMDGTVALLDVRSGDALWRVDVGAPARGTPAQSGSIIVVTTVASVVLGLDVSTGATKWTWTNPKRGWIFFPSIDHEANVVAVGTRESPTVVLAVKTGKPQCHLATTDGVWGPPFFSMRENVFAVAMTASSLVVGAADFNVSQICNGQLRGDAHPHYGNAVSPTFRQDIAPGVSGKAKYRYWIFSGPVSTPDGFLIVGANDGALHGLSKATGRIEWMIDVPRSGPITAPLVLSKDRATIWGVSEQGVVFSARRSPTNGSWHRDVYCPYRGASSVGNVLAVAHEESVFAALQAKSGGSVIARCHAAGGETSPDVVARLPLGCDVRSLGCVGCHHSVRAPNVTLIAGCKNGTWVAVFVYTPAPPPTSAAATTHHDGRAAESSDASAISPNTAQAGGGGWSWVWTGRFNDIALAVLAFLTLYSVAWRRAVLRARAARQLGTVP